VGDSTQTLSQQTSCTAPVHTLYGLSDGFPGYLLPGVWKVLDLALPAQCVAECGTHARMTANLFIFMVFTHCTLALLKVRGTLQPRIVDA
jgi:hypothetical protein